MKPPEREWVHISEPERMQHVGSFYVMSYNVLCDKYATRQVGQQVITHGNLYLCT